MIISEKLISSKQQYKAEIKNIVDSEILSSEIFCSLEHTFQDLLDSRNLISSKELH